MKQIPNEASNVRELTEEHNDKDIRVFDYAINNKRAKSKLLKGAKRGKHLVVESKTGCVNLIFSDGSYFQTVLPLLRLWHSQPNQKFLINETEVEVVEIDSGKDINQKHVDTKLVILADCSRLVLHAYNSKQKLMVQGQNYEKFALGCLEPFFKEKIDDTIEEINKINENIKESLSMDKDYKIEKSCPQCELVSNSSADLKRHMKSCHTKPSISSPPRHKVQKVLQEDISISELDEHRIIELEEEVTEDGQDCKWESCIFIAKDKTDLQKHFEDEHMNYLRKKYLSDGVQDMLVNEQLSKEDEGTSKVDDGVEKETNIEVVTIPYCNACEFETKICGDMEEHRKNGYVHNTEEPEIELRESIVICGTCAKGFQSETEIERHFQNDHTTVEVLGCEICKATFNNAFDLRRHTKSDHGYISRITGEICPFCKLLSKDLDTLRMHIENKHTRKPGVIENKQDRISIRSTDTCSKCPTCLFVGTDIELESHIKSKHEEKLTCQKCGKNFPDGRTLGDHFQSEHVHLKQVEPFPCQVCGLVFSDFTLLQNHVETFHKVEGVTCAECKNRFQTSEQLQEHMVEEHPEVIMFYNMAQQMEIMFNKFEDVTTSLNAMKQELFLIRTNQRISEPISTSHLKTSPPPPPPQPPSPLTLARTMTSSIVSGLERPKVSFAEAVKTSTWEQQHTPPSTLPPLSSSSPRPQCQPPHSPPKSPQRRSYAEVSQDVPRKSTTYVRPRTPKTLLIGDSISSNVHLEVLEEATDTKFVTAKAYSSVYDITENEAKAPARFPASNFKDVIPSELKKDEYKTLIVQAGAIDITNLNTKDEPTEHIDYFKKETINSAKNLFEAATNALKVQPTLEKVVILKQTPRYDPLNIDPLNIKPALSLLFNNSLMELWMDSPDKSKLHIGSHNIECAGAIREARYRHTRSGRYDGVHLFGSSGKKAYTMSVLNILRSAKLTCEEHNFHLSCPQAKHQSRQKVRNPGNQTFSSRGGYNVPTSNRFEVFRNTYQGNW